MSRRLQNLLVTGGCGFIGSAFIRRLFADDGFDGRIINLDLLTYAGNPANLDGGVDRSRYVFAHGDISDRANLEQLVDAHDIDTIVNFAAETHVDRSIEGPADFVQTNVVGVLSLLEVCRDRGLHLHQVSTDEVYGSLGPSGSFTEDHPYRPNSPYAASKASADHLVRAWHHTWDLSVTTSNCSNNYGPCQFPEKLIPLMVLNALAGEPLPVYGDGLNVRDWLHVDDHADAVMAILRDAPSGTVWNVGGRSERTNLHVLSVLLDAIAEYTGRDRAALQALITFVPDRLGHDRRYAVDCSRLEGALGWAPTVPFEAGLRATVRWYLQHPDWIEGVRSGSYREEL